MPKIKEAASQFLASKRVAVTGVSRQGKDHGSNVVYKRLREREYEVFAVNPNADEVEGDRCYHDLRSIPGGVEAVVIGTRRDRRGDDARGAPISGSTTCGCTAAWRRERLPAGRRVRSPAGIAVIDGGCPCMFDPPRTSGTRRCGSCSR